MTDGTGPPPGGDDLARTFPGDSDLARLMRRLDWSLTPLGPPDGWPTALRLATRLCLASRFPILLWWGPQLVKLYNDAYRPMIGRKHPGALGRAGAEVWPEIWPIIAPMLQGVLGEGRATWSEDQQLLLERHGFPEECYFTFSYSPVFGDEGSVEGVFTAVFETTLRVLGERRLQLLQALATENLAAGTVAEACRTVARICAGHPADLPFMLLYRVPAGGTPALLVAAAGLDPGHPAAPPALDPEAGPLWSLGRAVRDEQPVEIDLTAQPLTLPGGPWPEPARAAMVLPADRAPDGSRLVAVLGTSPRLPFDAAYRQLLLLVGQQISGAVAGARGREQERERAEELARLDRAKTTFFNNVSHEFRTPLTLLLGPLDEALEGLPPGAPEREPLATAKRNALRLLRLVNTLLDFSRLEAGRMTATFAPLDLAAFTREVAAAFRPVAERAGLRYEVDCPAGQEPVWVDADLWEQVVLNLVSNAYKFTLTGAIAIRLSWGGREVTLTVRDTGTGIPADELPRLFERFHRVRAAAARTYEGTGIGLALTRELVHLHGGRIEVESTEGQGTTMRVSLPLGHAHLPPGQLAAGGRATPSAAPLFVEEAARWVPPRAPDGPRDDARAPGGRPARILVVDDNADMRQHLRRLLEHAGWSVAEAGNGREALDHLEAHAVDLALVDVMMPVMDGREMVRRLRARGSDLPVVMVSARAGEEAVVAGLDEGVDDYLVKPFATRELVSRIRTHLRLARLRQQTTADRQRLEVRERERRLIGRELHDQVGQLLTAARLHVQMALRDRPAAPAGQATDLLDQAIEQVRSLSFRLRPPPAGNPALPATLRAMIDGLVAPAGLAATVDLAPGLERAPPGVQEAAFRIVQEALTNVVRHARARAVQIAIRPGPAGLVVDVRDDGVGIDPGAAAGFHASVGVAGMVERARELGGRLEVRSFAGKGTQVLAVLPLEPADDGTPDG
jgi:signal transduction histidine kinase